MNHWEIKNAIHLYSALKESGFEVSQICCSRASCFDFAAKKRDITVLLKVASEIDAFPASDMRELKVIANRIPAAPLIVSQLSHGKPLEDDTVYSRNNVYVVNEKTVKGIAMQTGNPLVCASPGGYTVEVDGALVERRRKDLGLSIGQLAALIGVSRRTLYGYERGMAKASVSSAYKLAETLGVPIVRPVNILAKTQRAPQCLLPKTKHDLMTKLLLRQVFKKFCTCDISPIHKAPFDFVMNVPNENYLIIGGVASADEPDLNSRVDEILSICRVVYAYPVLITENKKNTNLDLSCFTVEDLRVLRSAEELIASAYQG
ncbi:MAG: helix-turn-helix domain-containing protein [Candidatus Bathyarchaeia archaeon]|jgi:putative transcriptional regulator